MTSTSEADQDGLNLSRLAKVLARAASENDEEALAAIRSARRMLSRAGLDFIDLAAALEEHASVAASVTSLEETVAALRHELRKLKACERLRLSIAQTAAPAAAETADLKRKLSFVSARLQETRRKLHETESERDALYICVDELAEEVEDLKASIALAASALDRSTQQRKRLKSQRAKSDRQHVLF